MFTSPAGLLYNKKDQSDKKVRGANTDGCSFLWTVFTTFHLSFYELFPLVNQVNESNHN